MKMKLVLGIVLVLAASAKLHSDGFPAGKWIDLSHDFSDETIYWVTAEPFKRETVAEGMTDKGYYYSAYNYSAAEHGGTHIDSPIHFAEGRKTVDEIRQHLNVDSLGYLSLDGMHRAVAEHGPFCDACFSGNYPAPLVDLQLGRAVASHC